MRREDSRSKLPYRWVRIWEHEVKDGSFKERLKDGGQEGGLELDDYNNDINNFRKQTENYEDLGDEDLE